MFTGLITDCGIIKKIEPNATGKIFTFQCSSSTAHELALGDSIAVNGVCLTVTHKDSSHFSVQAVHVTLEKTALGLLSINDWVNLELALRVSDRFGGHFVQGHVNGIGTIKEIHQRGTNYEFSISIAKDLQKYIIQEGSIALDGISLTIARWNNSLIMVSIIPHTWQNTTLHKKKCGDQLNIEIDILAKYVQNCILKPVVSNNG